MPEQNEKLELLAELEGYEDGEDLVGCFLFSSVVPGICTEEGCEGVVEVEPDCDTGWCCECNKNSVSSCLCLGGVM